MVSRMTDQNVSEACLDVGDMARRESSTTSAWDNHKFMMRPPGAIDSAFEAHMAGVADTAVDSYGTCLPGLLAGVPSFGLLMLPMLPACGVMARAFAFLAVYGAASFCG